MSVLFEEPTPPREPLSRIGRVPAQGLRLVAPGAVVTTPVVVLSPKTALGFSDERLDFRVEVRCMGNVRHGVAHRCIRMRHHAAHSISKRLKFSIFHLLPCRFQPTY